MKNKPGRGWKNIGGAVWDHASGLRLHVYGLLGLPGGELIHATRWPESESAERFIRIAGGSRKRGLMLWAMSKLTPPNQGASK